MEIKSISISQTELTIEVQARINRFIAEALINDNQQISKGKAVVKLIERLISLEQNSTKKDVLNQKEIFKPSFENLAEEFSEFEKKDEAVQMSKRKGKRKKENN